MTIDVLIIVGVAAFVNYFTRVLPFLFFLKKEPPEFVLYIEKYFPAVIMTILVFYTVKDSSFSADIKSYKEIFAICLTIVVHLAFKNFLLSIFAGTLFFMGWVQYL